MEFFHAPVMPEECMEGLAIKPDGIYVDGTTGGGGHSERIARLLFCISCRAMPVWPLPPSISMRSGSVRNLISSESDVYSLRPMTSAIAP